MSIVDDIATSRKLQRVTFEAEGHNAPEAADGVKALQIPAREKVESISDVSMPGMDGCPLCFEIRRHPEWKVAARALGGSLTVHGHGPGQGAEFTLELPALTLNQETNHEK